MAAAYCRGYTSLMSEDEYLALVERIQQAMCIEPFRPDVTDVVMLIGEWQVQHHEIERLRTELHRVAEGRRGQRERADGLRAALDEALAIDHSKRGCCEWHVLNGKPWIPPPTGVIHVGSDKE